MKKSPNSIWNRVCDEKKIFDIMADKYLAFYRGKAEEIKVKLNENKEVNTSSYFTYDVGFYVNPVWVFISKS